MKIGIVGDAHFGGAYTIGKTDPSTQLNSRLIDFSNTLNSIIDNFVKEGVKMVVFTGDCFESKNPSSSQLNAFSKCIKRATGFGLTIVIVVGNHDQQRSVETTAVDIFSHLEIPNVYVFQNLGVKTFKDEHGKDFHLILMPYRDRRMINTQNNSEAIEVIRSELADTIKDKVGTKILVGHLMLEKTEEAENPDGFSINELVLPLNIFNGLDAVFMGHIHKHEVKSKKDPVIIYTGSMDKVSFGEKNHTKVSIIIDTNNVEDFKIIDTKTRNILELNFDYSGENKLYKENITSKIIEEIDKFDDQNSMKDAIFRLVGKVKDNDLHHVNHNKIKEHLLNKKVDNVLPLQITSTTSRQLRNANIREDTDTKKAMGSFINNLSEPDVIKKKLQKYAESIIDECK